MKYPLSQLFSGIIVLVFIALAVGSSPGPSRRNRKKPTTEESIMSNPNLSDKEKQALIEKRNKKIAEDRKTNTVAAIDLVQEYDNNEVSADQKYKRKTIFVEGYIEHIGKDLFDEIYVTLSGPEDGLRSVSCDINNEKVVSQLQKGQWLVVRGVCDGLMLDVQMINCEVIEVLDVDESDADTDAVETEESI